MAAIMGRRGKEPDRSRSRVRKDAPERLEKALADAVREACREECVSASADLEITLELKAVVRPGGTGGIGADPPLKDQVLRAVREAGARELVFHPGRVYCYRCESSICPHSAPSSPTAVFGGYSPTGIPRWPELTEVLIAARHPSLDLVFDTSASRLAATCSEADALKHLQLSVFGRQSKTYDILAQAAFGFLRFPGRRDGSRGHERAAVTLQAVEIRCRSRRPKVVLNVIGLHPEGGETVEALSGSYQMRVLDSIITARRLLARLHPGQRGSSAAGTEAGRILRKTAKALERLGRQSGRRTGHAEKRRVDRRPTAKALEEALAAQDERLLWDEQRSTVVVIGSRNRVHVFNPEGRHVTSLSLKREEVEGRKRRERWQALPPEGCRKFRAALAAAVKEGEGPQRRMSRGT
jgi:hypothetical protein